MQSVKSAYERFNESRPIQGLLTIALAIALTVILQQAGAIDLLTSFTDVWIWLVLIPMLSAGFSLIGWGVGKRTQRDTAKDTKEPNTVLDPQITAVLIRLAKSDFRRTLRDQVKYIWQDVEKESWHPRFRIWKDLDPVLKKLLVPYKPEYDALDDFVNALDQFSDNQNKADSDALKTLCKNRFDRLKELGLVY
jgi:hypothetical protein